MLGLEDYGSGSETSDPETVDEPPKANLPTKSFLSLPPPKASSSKRPLPLKPKKIISIPSLKPTAEKDHDEPQRPAKKPRLEAGAGSSSLLSMLPAPKQRQVQTAPERILGGGSGPGLVFRSSPLLQGASDVLSGPVAGSSSSSTTFLPISLTKGRANISLEEEKSIAPPRTSASKILAAPAIDFFSLNTSDSSTKSPTVTPAGPLTKVSSAPSVPAFDVPEPTPTDPYPGYYQLPSGQWAAYDPAYYSKFTKKWQTAYDAHVRALEKGTAKGFEAMDDNGVEEVDAMKEMERAKVDIKEREERKAITMGAGAAPAAPKMKVTASKQSGIARSRHQLSTLLMEAYQNREALEEKIAEGRRNRKEAGNKYGF